MSGGFAVQIDPGANDRLLELARRFPRETYKGLGRAGSTIRAQLRKVMKSGGGLHGVPTFKPHTVETEALQNERGDADRRLGGKLVDASAIQMYRKKGEFTVGFVDGLLGYASSFQSDENRQLTRNERFYFLRYNVDTRVYNRAERPIFDPFADEASKNILTWAVRNTEKILEKAGKR